VYDYIPYLTGPQGLIRTQLVELRLARIRYAAALHGDFRFERLILSALCSLLKLSRSPNHARYARWLRRRLCAMTRANLRSFSPSAQRDHCAAPVLKPSVNLIDTTRSGGCGWFWLDGAASSSLSSTCLAPLPPSDLAATVVMFRKLISRALLRRRRGWVRSQNRSPLHTAPATSHVPR
jgi:hypothetical protein